MTFEYKGMRCFIPYSRLDPSRLPPNHDFGSDDLSDMQPLIGQKLSARVIQARARHISSECNTLHEFYIGEQEVRQSSSTEV